MRIANSSVALGSHHEFTSTQQSKELLKIVGKVPKSESEKLPSKELMRQALRDSLELSEEALKKSKKELGNITNAINLSEAGKLDLSEKDKQRLLILAEFIKKLTGKDIKINIPDELKLALPFRLKPSFHLDPSIENLNAVHENNYNNDGENWAAEYRYQDSYYERESLSFSADGIINTSDGRQISFALDLSMTREFASKNSIDVRMGNTRLLDPLVINYDGIAADVTQTSFKFDIDSDGKEDQISNLSRGSGFLALDVNQDGVINDGSELFGTKSGNGFDDLSKYDSDHNNWIDENDPIFNKLRIWTVDDDGSKHLFSLGEKGIGAIYLGNAEASFGIKDFNNDLHAQSKSAGIFLRENGSVGTVQQIDFVV